MCQKAETPKATILVPPGVSPELVKTWAFILGPNCVNNLIGDFFAQARVEPAAEIPLSEITDVCDQCGLPLEECDCEEVCDACGKPLGECECVCEACGEPKRECECEDDDECDYCPYYNRSVGAYEAYVTAFLNSLVSMIDTYDEICGYCEYCTEEYAEDTDA